MEPTTDHSPGDSGLNSGVNMGAEAKAIIESVREQELAKVEARTLKGFRDIHPEIAIQKHAMLDTLRMVFQGFGFDPIETPHLEYTEVLTGRAGSEINKQIYRFRDQGDRDVTLRFDLTVPFARYVVQNRGQIEIPFRRYAIGEVFRGESPQAGRYREFTQCDFDLVGSSSIAADAEVVLVMASAMKALGVENFEIHLNNRKLLNGLILELGLDGKEANILRVIDKVGKIGIEATEETLTNEIELSAAQARSVLEFVLLSSNSKSSEELITKTAALCPGNQLFHQGLSELAELVKLIKCSDIHESEFCIDYSIARGLGYYTGIVYETFLRDFPELGSVCSGGRYDDLTKSFSNEELSGVGASVGLDRLMAGLDKLGKLSKRKTCADVLIMQPAEDLREGIFESARTLRSAGFKVDVYPDATKLKKQFKYAEAKGHRYAVIPRKETDGRLSFQLKNLETQQAVVAPDTSDLVRQALRQSANLERGAGHA